MTHIAPGVYTSERQFADVALQTAQTIPLIVGGATKGVLDTPTKVSSTRELTQVFGDAVDTDYGLLSAIEFLKNGQTLLFMRVANGEATSKVTLLGKPISTAGVKATGTITISSLPVDDTDDVTINDGVSGKTFEFDQAVAAAGTITVGTESDADTVTMSDGYVTRTFELDTPVAATGEVDFATFTYPDAATITINDGTKSLTFEIDDGGGVAPGNIAISEGGDDTEMGDNLVAALAARTDLDVTGINTTGTVALANGTKGTAGNQTITDGGTSHTFTVTGMSGGEDLTATPGNIPVEHAATPTLTAENLRDAINTEAGYAITASITTATIIDVVNDIPGTVGNAAFTTTGSTFTLDPVGGVFTSGVDAGVTGANVAVTIGADKNACALNLAVAISSQSNYALDASVNTAGADPVITITNRVTGTFGNVPIPAPNGSSMAATGMDGGVDEVLGSDVSVMDFEATSPGSWGDGTDIAIAATAVNGAPEKNYDLTVTAIVDTQGTTQVVERFENLTNDPSSDRYVETVVNDGVRGETEKSAYVVATQTLQVNPNAGSFSLGVTTAGLDGITGLVAADYVGTVTSGVSSGLQASLNQEKYSFNILAIPGVSHRDVITAMLSVADDRGDCFVLPDPPLGLNDTDIVAWHNGDGFAIPDAPLTALDNNYAALYWGWGNVYSEFLRKTVTLPPSAYMLGVCAFNDKNGGPWLAPAGFERGVTTAKSVELSPDQTQRNVIQTGNNKINPLVEFNNDVTGGLDVVCMGNQTLTRTPGPLDAVHVRRMVLFAKKTIARAVRHLGFRPNSPSTWEEFKQIVNPILESIKAGGGLEIFKVKIDATTNTVEVRQKKHLDAVLQLKHIDAAEVINLDFAMYDTGVDFETGA